MSGVTSNGSLWIVSPGAVARRAIWSSRSPGKFGKSDLGQGDRQADFRREAENLLDRGAGRAFEHQLHEQTEGDLLAVEIGVRAGCDGQAVVHGVGRRQAGGFEAQAREQGVCLDQPLERGGHDLGLHGPERGGSVFEQGLVAELGQGGRAAGRAAAPHVLDVPRDARPGLEPGGQGIAHPRDQQPRRCLGDHLGIDQDQVGILAVEPVFLERPRRRNR